MRCKAGVYSRVRQSAAMRFVCLCGKCFGEKLNSGSKLILAKNRKIMYNRDMKFTQLKAHIDGGRLLPCYIATGEDFYLVKKAEELFSAAIEFPQLNIAFLGAGVSQSAAFAALSTLPFMSEKRLVVAEGLKPDFFAEYLKNPLSSTVLLVKGEGLKATAGMEIVDCDRLEMGVLVASIKAECGKNNAEISDGAAALLAQYCLRFMGRIRGELHKLIDFKNGGIITEGDVKAVVVPDLEYKVFELSSAIVRGEGERALRLLDDMLTAGHGAASMVFGILYSHFRRLFAVSLSPNDPNLSGYLEIKDTALRFAAADARTFSKLKLKRITDSLHRLDADIKTGKISDRLGLETFVMSAINERN